jgi:aminotransferase
LRDYRERRDYLVPVLRQAGFVPFVPAGAYYVMADITQLGYGDDVAFARYLVEDIGLAVVPGCSFFPTAHEGAAYVRFAFPKRMSTLQRAANLIKTIERR